MNKSELTRELVKRLGRKSPADDIVPGLFTIIHDELTQGREVHIKNFGTFSTTVRRPRNVPNPQKPSELIQCPATRVVKFQPSQTLKKSIKSL